MMLVKAIAGASKLSVLQELLRVLPKQLEPADASLVGEKNINLWLHHLVPDELRDAGKQPISVKADGTCMFRSISIAIYGNEDSWCFIKLQALKYGTLQFDDVIRRLQIIDQVCGSLCHQITDSATFNECSQLRDPIEQLKACALAEVVKSVDFYRFGTLLHLMLISGAMKAIINCFSKQEVLEQKILQDDAEMDVAIIDSDNCDITCNGVAVCARFFGHATEARFILCHYCLRRYHEYCVGERFVLGEKWNCSCHININALTSLPMLNDKEEAKKLLLARSKDIEKFSANISKKLIFSPRIFMFEANSSELLREMSNFMWLMDSSVIIAYLIHRIDDISITHARELIHRRV
eukprot:gene10076-18725_t